MHRWTRLARFPKPTLFVLISVALSVPAALFSISARFAFPVSSDSSAPSSAHPSALSASVAAAAPESQSQAAPPPPQQQKLTTEPDPSYAPGGPGVRRHPEVDTDVSLYINHWRNSAPRIGHGGLIERDILARGDPLHPARKGAVLKYIASYEYATLEARVDTQHLRSPVEQAFFYVMSGTGTLETAAKKAALEEGVGAFVPAGLEYRLTNPGPRPLEMILVIEEIAPGFKPQTEISSGSYRNAVPAVGHHWSHVARAFLYDVPPRFSNPMGFAIVSIDSFDIAQPHTHGPGIEEIWCQLKGKSLLFFGNRLLHQEPGEAFLIPPNDKVPHASINPTDEPMTWLYMGCTHEEDMPKPAKSEAPPARLFAAASR